MSYLTITKCANDPSIVARVSAAVAQEQNVRGDPIDPAALTDAMRWAVATAADVESAYASALAGGNPDPGGDEAVVTDPMILAHVQAAWSP